MRLIVGESSTTKILFILGLSDTFRDTRRLWIWPDRGGHNGKPGITAPGDGYCTGRKGITKASYSFRRGSTLLKEAHCPDFVNVDSIAAGLSPFDPARAAFQAGRIMLSEIQRCVRKGESFAFETTLSGHIYARWIPQWRRAGYRVRSIFLSLPDAEAAIERVAARVAQGGHDVARADIRRRFHSGLRNFEMVYREEGFEVKIFFEALLP